MFYAKSFLAELLSLSFSSSCDKYSKKQKGNSREDPFIWPHSSRGFTIIMAGKTQKQPVESWWQDELMWSYCIYTQKAQSE